MAKGKQNMWEREMAIVRAMTLWVGIGLQLLWLPKKMGRESGAKFYVFYVMWFLQHLFETEKRPIEY